MSPSSRNYYNNLIRTWFDIELLLSCYVPVPAGPAIAENAVAQCAYALKSRIAYNSIITYSMNIGQLRSGPVSSTLCSVVTSPKCFQYAKKSGVAWGHNYRLLAIAFHAQTASTYCSFVHLNFRLLISVRGFRGRLELSTMQFIHRTEKITCICYNRSCFLQALATVRISFITS